LFGPLIASPSAAVLRCHAGENLCKIALAESDFGKFHARRGSGKNTTGTMENDDGNTEKTGNDKERQDRHFFGPGKAF
jgi:hypothetical protein